MKILQKFREIQAEMRAENLQQKPPVTPEAAGSWRDSVIGLIMLVFVVFLGYAVGNADGRKAATAEIPQLAKVDAHLDRFERACHLQFDQILKDTK